MNDYNEVTQMLIKLQAHPKQTLKQLEQTNQENGKEKILNPETLKNKQNNLKKKYTFRKP